MRPSKYLKRLTNKPLTDYLDIPGDGLIVERIPPEEIKTKSGLIIPVDTGAKQINTYKTDLPTFVHVVAVGAGYYNEETKESVPLETKPGDLLLVGMTSVKWFSNFFEIEDYEAYDLGFMLESDKNLRIKGYESYEKIRKLFEPLKESGQ